MRVSFAAVCAIGWAALTAGQRAAAADQTDASEAPCQPAAHVAAASEPATVEDTELGRAVGLELAVLGVVIQDIPARCAVVEARVARVGEGVAVSVRDVHGREAQQVVSDPRVAAVWIETWAHPELGAPLLSVRAAPEAPQPAATVTSAAPVDVAPAETAAGASRRGLGLTATGAMLFADDDSDWREVAASACVRFGAMCAGLRAELADDRGHTAHSMDLAAADRLSFAVLAVVSASIDVGRMRLQPSGGLGVGYTRTGRAGGSSCDLNEDRPDGESCTAPYAIDDGFSDSTLGLRADLGLSAAFPITTRLSFVIGAGIEWALLARDQPVAPGYAEEYFSDSMDPGTMDPDKAPLDMLGLPFEAYALPGEPTRFTRVGVGLSLEVP